MKLNMITINNFRRIERAEIILASSSFVIGPNNSGKTSVIDAIDALLSLKSEKITENDFRIKEDGSKCDQIELTGKFTNINNEVANSRGFNGRVINGEFIYKKTYNLNKVSKPKIECVSYPKFIKSEFIGAKTVLDLLNLGISQKIIDENLNKKDASDKLPKDWENKFDEIFDINEDEDPIFEENPGGFPSNVNSKLPKVIRIPSLVNLSDLEAKDRGSSILSECLSVLFDDILSTSELAYNIQEKLNELEKEMKPDNEGSLIKRLTNDVNKIIESVFPKCGIEIIPNLQNLNDILKPKYEVALFSNVKTDVAKQGTGLIRTTAFAMLRFHSNLKVEKKIETRPVLVAFEEPEIYLHPAAANMLRDTIYALGKTDQIICNTHSPWMIDLSQEPLSLTKMQTYNNQYVSCINYGLTNTYAKLAHEDKTRVKMLQLFDDEISRVFFAERVIIVEGDTEILAIKNTIKLLPEDIRKLVQANVQIVKARGKASIISLVKYLHDLKIYPIVMHDRDKGVEGAEKFNKPIADAVNDNSRLILNEECIEDTLGYSTPSSDKPYKAFIESEKWKSLGDIPDSWKKKVEFIFDIKF